MQKLKIVPAAFQPITGLVWKTAFYINQIFFAMEDGILQEPLYLIIIPLK
jgi:hypothetical protein